MAENFTAKPDDAERGAKIILCSVIGVDFVNYTVDLVAENAARDAIPDVPYASPYISRDGFGFSFNPGIGDQCYLLESRDGTRCILAFVTLPATQDGKSSYAGKRRPGNTGDFSINTPEGNFLRVLRGGLVELGASHMCKRAYVPILNLVRDTFVSYNAISPLGEIIWEHTSTDENPASGSVVAAYRLKRRIGDTVTDGALYKVEVCAGDLTAPGLAALNRQQHAFAAVSTISGATEHSGVFSVTVATSDGARAAFSFQLADDGAFSFVSTEVGYIDVKKLRVKTSEGFEVEFPGGIVSGDENGAITMRTGNGISTINVTPDGGVSVVATALAINIGGITLNLGASGVSLIAPPGTPMDLGLLGLGIQDGATAILNVDGLLNKILNHKHKFVIPPAASLASAVVTDTQPSTDLTGLSAQVAVLQSTAKLR